MTTHNGASATPEPEMGPDEIQAVIDRILAKDPASSSSGSQRRFGSGPGGRAQALSDLDEEHTGYDGEQQDREERRALRRVAGLSTELEDVTEVEYRQLRLERVVLAGIWAKSLEHARRSGPA